MTETSTIHASAVLIGPKAALIRGPAGSGKSRLVWDLLQAATHGAPIFARLIADDRALIEACAGRLLVRSVPALAGMIEIRGIGILRLDSEPLAAVGMVVDLAAEDAARHPSPAATQITIDGAVLPRLAVAPGVPAAPLLMAFLKLPPAGI